MHLCPLIISAPFGNYLRFPGTTATRGTFTAARRGGPPWRLWRVAWTVRYSFRTHVWRNKLGLPNPGIDAFIHEARHADLPYATVVSVYGFNEAEWHAVVTRVLEGTPYPVELNLSCPNVDHRQFIGDVLPAVRLDPLRMIAKLPPIEWLPMAEALYAVGVRTFHACNTLWTPGGGLSGKVLKPYSLWALHDLRHRFGAEVRLIGGGGITQPSDIADYYQAGANHVAIGSLLFNPLAWRRVSALQQYTAQLLREESEVPHAPPSP